MSKMEILKKSLEKKNEKSKMKNEKVKRVKNKKGRATIWNVRHKKIYSFYPFCEHRCSR